MLAGGYRLQEPIRRPFRGAFRRRRIRPARGAIGHKFHVSQRHSKNLSLASICPIRAAFILWIYEAGITLLSIRNFHEVMRPGCIAFGPVFLWVWVGLFVFAKRLTPAHGAWVREIASIRQTEIFAIRNKKSLDSNSRHAYRAPVVAKATVVLRKWRNW